MSSNTTAKFWFEHTGRKFGARFLTIGEQVQAQVEIERLTNGKYGEWMKSGDDLSFIAALSAQVVTYLDKAVVAWPVDLPKIDFMESDDFDLMMEIWEAYSNAVKDFRESRKAPGAGAGESGAEPAPAVVP